MNIDRNIPRELKTFWKLFDKLCYRWDYARVFDDFLTMCIPNFSFNSEYAENRDHALKGYCPDEIQLFRDCFYEMIKVYNEMLQIQKWYDFFGELYQAITGEYKSQRMGQFFTPAPICDMMVQIVNPGEMEKDRIINDPACGSSRMLLAAYTHALYQHNKRVYLVGQDVDPICCKMSVMNFVFHGCQGEILCMNTITMEYRYGYSLKTFYPVPIPRIEPLSLENSSLFKTKEIVEVQSVSPDELFDLSEFENNIEKQKQFIKKSLKKKTVEIQEELFV